jgi:hypothetical protein
MTTEKLIGNKISKIEKQINSLLHEKKKLERQLQIRKRETREIHIQR